MIGVLVVLFLFVYLVVLIVLDGSVVVCWVWWSWVGWCWIDGVDVLIGEECEVYCLVIILIGGDVWIVEMSEMVVMIGVDEWVVGLVLIDI